MKRLGRYRSLAHAVARLWLAGPIALQMACLAYSPPEKQPYPIVDPWRGDVEGTLPLADDEHTLWSEARESFDEFVEADDLIVHPSLENYLHEVLDRLDPMLRTHAPRIRVGVFEDVHRNAHALADGTILITASLLAALEDEAQLAFLLGHEIAHVRLRHGLMHRRYEELTPSHIDRMRLSRRLENVADEHGLNFAVEAGYDAKSAIQMLDHLDEEVPPSWRVREWDSHAGLQLRSARLKAAVDSEPSAPGRAGADEYQRALDSIRLDVADFEIDEGELDRAEQFVKLHLERWPEEGRGYFLRGEINRRRPAVGRRDPGVRTDYERAIELVPDDADALRALGLVLLDAGEISESHALLSRYLEVSPQAIDQKLIERYLGRR